ncbi:MAG: hypothetical protein AAF371_15230 [Pseudomonadota bacterium]
MTFVRAVLEVSTAALFCVGVQMLLGHLSMPAWLSVAEVKIAVALSALVSAASLFSRLQAIRLPQLALALGLVGGVLSIDLFFGEGEAHNAEDGLTTEQLIERWVPAPHRCMEQRCIG